MKPCAKNRKLISWLAMDALDAPIASELQAHLDTCTGCQQYLAEMRQVTGQLAAAEPKSEVQTSESFHQAWLERVQAGNRTPLQLRDALAALQQLRWRVAILAGAALTIVCLIGFLTFRGEPTPPNIVPVLAKPLAMVPTTTAPEARADFSPALANYQRVASQSLDKLDDLLLHQGNQASRSTPVCTASATSLDF